MYLLLTESLEERRFFYRNGGHFHRIVAGNIRPADGVTLMLVERRYVEG